MHLSGHVFLKEFGFQYLASLLLKIQKEIEETRTVLFVEASALESIQIRSSFVAWIEYGDSKNFENLILLIHNGDQIPPKSFFDVLTGSGIDVYSVNSSGNEFGVKPLPIGLENRHLRRNGIIKHFDIDQDCTFRINDNIGPKSELFASFNVSTNIIKRSEAQTELEKFGYKLTIPNLTPKKYRKCIKKSRFVISPPGNGRDCHRTWEAIYLGAVPVVLRESLNEELISLFPIVAVGEWSEFLGISPRERQDLCAQFNGQTYPALNIEYWRKLFNGSIDRK